MSRLSRLLIVVCLALLPALAIWREAEAQDGSGSGPILVIEGAKEPHWSQDESRILTLSPDDEVQVRDGTTGDILFTLPYNSKIYRAEWFQNGTTIVTVSENDDVAVWDALTGEKRFEISDPEIDHENMTQDVVNWNHSGTQIATADSDGDIKIWSATSGEMLLTLKHDAALRAISWSQDDTRILIGDRSGIFKIWDAATGENLLILSDLSGEFIRWGTWNQDGTQILTETNESGIQIWDAATGNNVLTYDRETTYWARELVLDRSQLLTVVGEDISLWDVATGANISTFSAGADVSDVAFNNDETQIIASTRTTQGIIQLWDIDSGRNLLTLSFDGFIDVIDLSNDGTKLMVGLVTGNDFYIQIWDISSPVAFLPVSEATDLNAMFAENVVGADPQFGHYEGSDPQVSFDITEDGYLTNFQIEAPVSGGGCTVRAAALPVEEGRFFIQAEGQTTGGIFINGETVVGTYEILMCGDTVFFDTEAHPWMASLSTSE